MGTYAVSTFEGSATQPGAKAESVAQYISNLHPSVAVIRSLLETIPIDHDIPEWQIDKYALTRTQASTQTRLKQVGADATDADTANPQRICNQTSIIHDGIKVARTVRQIRLHGITDVLDYGIDQVIHTVLDDYEMQFHFGMGNYVTPNPEVKGMLGLVPWAAWTGLERRHGTPGATVTLPFSNARAIPAAYYSSFFNAGGALLSREMLYNEILGPWWNIGGEVDGCFMLCGDKIMSVIADMHMSTKGAVNQRMIPARDKALVDCIVSIQTPAMGEFYCMADRFLSIPGQSVTIDNRPIIAFGGAATGAGTITAAGVGTVPCYYEETVLLVMPEHVQIGSLSPIAYAPLATSGDYVRGMIVGEETLIVRHPIAVAGATNLLP